MIFKGRSDGQTDALFRRMEQWADTISYPVRPGSAGPVKAAGLGDAVKARYVGLLLKAAARLRAIKPANLAHTRVVASVVWPDVSEAGVEVLFDQAAWDAFTQRNSHDASWSPIEGETLSARLGVAVPEGFHEHGYRFYHRDDAFDPPVVDEGEYWFYSEVPADD